LREIYITSLRTGEVVGVTDILTKPVRVREVSNDDLLGTLAYYLVQGSPNEINEFYKVWTKLGKVRNISVDELDEVKGRGVYRCGELALLVWGNSVKLFRVGESEPFDEFDLFTWLSMGKEEKIRLLKPLTR